MAGSDIQLNEMAITLGAAQLSNVCLGARKALLRRSDPIARSRSRCLVVQALHGHASVLRSRAP